MAEGGVYDPTTENETPWEDHGIDHDDDDEQEVNTTQPFQPGASSTLPMKVKRMKWPTWAKKGKEFLPFLNTLILCPLKRRKLLSTGLKRSSKPRAPNSRLQQNGHCPWEAKRQ